MEKNKTLYLVLGCHRSGTSATAGTLAAMGMHLGDDLMPPTEHNPKGYFEHMAFHKHNEKVLDFMGCSWDDVSKWDKHMLLAAMNRAPLQRLLKKEFKDKDHLVLKDPRISVLVPLYQAACDKLGIDIKYIIVLRSEDEVTASLMDRDGFDEKKARRIYQNYQTRIYSDAIGQALVIWYRDLLSDTVKTVKALSVFTGVQDYDINKIKEFLDPSLKHF